MSEHHRGAWGTREDALWWPSAISSQDYTQTLQTHHQHLLNQHQQQQLAAQQQQHQAQQQQQQQHQQQQQQQQQQENVSRSSATQQLFSYKMASSFQNPATTMTAAAVSASSPVGVGSCMRGYDYNNMVNPGMLGGANRGVDPQQWWSYSTGMGNPMQNAQPSPPIVSQQQNRVGRMPRAKADAKPRGRMTAYAFFVQTCREEHKKKHPDENVVFAEFSKKCAERWKTMSDKEKKRFHEMAEKDKKRYDTEMEGYIPPKGEKTRGKKRKHVKDPNAPKRSLSAFFWFCNDERGKVKAINPEYGVGDIAKELGRRWSDVDPDLKTKYEAMAEKDKARYDREMTAYKKKAKLPVPPPVAQKVVSDEDDEDDDEDGDEDDDE